jgi:hypothetical protein
MKWEDPWFRKLPPEKKLLWLFIADKCDNAGVWKVDYELATFTLGAAVSEETVLAFNDEDKTRIKVLNGGSLLFMFDYVDFQIGDIAVFAVSEKATNLQKNCVATICKYMQRGLLTEEDYGLVTGTLPVSYPYPTGVGIGKGKGKGKDSQGESEGWWTLEDCKRAAEGIGMLPADIEAFWSNYASVGWIDAAGRQIVNLKAALAKWKANQPSHGKVSPTGKPIPRTQANPQAPWNNAYYGSLSQLQGAKATQQYDPDSVKNCMSILRNKYGKVVYEGKDAVDEAIKAFTK